MFNIRTTTFKDKVDLPPHCGMPGWNKEGESSRLHVV